MPKKPRPFKTSGEPFGEGEVNLVLTQKGLSSKVNNSRNLPKRTKLKGNPERGPKPPNGPKKGTKLKTLFLGVG